MANALYDKGRQAFAGGAINWTSDTIKAVLVDTGQYTVNLASHQYLSDIASGARIATSAALTTPTDTAGVCDADDVSIGSVSGNVGAIVLYKDTGSASTSPLIAYLDTGSGLPVSNLSGATVNIAWDNTSGKKIFKL